MKTLVSGIIGAAVSTVGWYSVVHNFEGDFPYLALVVGAITGLAVRMGADAKTGESIGRGAMAAVLALAACVGGQFGYKAYIENVIKDAGKPGIPQEVAKASDGEKEDNAEESAEESSEDSAEDTTEVADKRAEDQEKMRLARQGGALEPEKNALKFEKPDMSKSSMLDILWLCGSALLAYVFGKGGGSAPAATDQAASESEGSEESSEQQGEG